MDTPIRPKGFVPMILALTLAIGGTIVWVFVVLTGASLWNSVTPASMSKVITVTQAGQVLIQQYHRSFVDVTYQTLEGKLVTDAAELKFSQPARINPPDAGNPRRHFQWHERLVSYKDNRLPATFWYLLLDTPTSERAYFVGYDSKSRRLIGYIGLNGFRSTPPTQDERFDFGPTLMTGNHAGVNSGGQNEPYSYAYPDRDQATVWVISEGKLFLVDLTARSVRPISLPSPIHRVSVAIGEPDAGNNTYRLFAQADDRVFVLSLAGSLLYTISLPEQLRDDDLQLYHWWRPQCIVYYQEPGTLAQHVYWVQGGKITREQKIELNTDFSFSGQLWKMAISVPSPAAWGLVCVLAANEKVGRSQEPNLYNALVSTIREAKFPFLAVCLLSAVASVYCYRRHRRYSDQGSLRWAIFVLITGVPGLVGYWLHRRWPPTEHCRRCGKNAPRDRETCRYCETVFPTPIATGKEILCPTLAGAEL